MSNINVCYVVCVFQVTYVMTFVCCGSSPVTFVVTGQSLLSQKDKACLVTGPLLAISARICSVRKAKQDFPGVVRICKS